MVPGVAPRAASQRLSGVCLFGQLVIRQPHVPAKIDRGCVTSVFRQIMVDVDIETRRLGLHSAIGNGTGSYVAVVEGRLTLPSISR